MGKFKIPYAIILAGGKGERLRPHTSDRPKPMVDLNGEPIVAYQIRQLKKVGVKEIVFACSYKHEFLRKAIGRGTKYGIKAKYSIEKTPLGRGGGIKQAMGMLPKGWKEVLVTNGDNLWKIDLDKIITWHHKRRPMVTIVGVPLKSPYGIIEFNSKYEITNFREKPELAQHIVNAGVYVFSSEIEPLLPTIGDHETETFPDLVKDLQLLLFPSHDYWKGIDNFGDLNQARKDVENLHIK